MYNEYRNLLKIWTPENFVVITLKLYHKVIHCLPTCQSKNLGSSSNFPFTYEPPHDKTNKMTVHPAKTKISLGIRPVWSESSLYA